MKTVSIYKLNDLDVLKKIKLEETLDDFSMYKFKTCAGTELEKRGFVQTPIDGEYVSQINDLTVLRIATQVKKPNKNKVKDLLAIKCKVYNLENNLDVTPKKVVNSLKETAQQEVILDTYPEEEKYSYVVFTKDGLVYVEGKHKQAEVFLGLIRKALGSLPVTPLDTERSVTDFLDQSVLVSGTLEKETKFTLGEKVVLVDLEGQKATLDKTYVTQSKAVEYLNEGYFVSQLAYNYDGVVSFILDSDMCLNGVKYDSCLEDDLGEDTSIEGLTFIQIASLDKTIKALLTQLEEGDEE
jgi:recombination associated protein RdgC